MRKTLLTILFAFGSLLNLFASVHRVGTYNIRTSAAQEDTGEKSWAKRRETVMTVIRDSANFDVVALQEVTSGQRTYIHDNLKNVYSFAENDRNASNQLLYRTSKYNCLDKGYFYLAPDPTKPGHYWDAEFERFVVWAKLQDKESKEILYFAATHLDLHPISIREGARTATEQMMKICGDYACVLTGDMNCELIERDPHLYYSTSFGNARNMSKTPPQGPYCTYVGSRKPTSVDGKWIDFVYVRGVEVESYKVDTTKGTLSILPSDHMPVVSEVTLLPYNRKRTHVVNNVAELRAEAGKIPAGEIIYLKRGAYDLDSTSLNLVSSCVIQGNEDAYLTGSCQLLTLAHLTSVELRELTIKDATCPQGGFGSIVNGNGRYVRLVDCTVENCSTDGTCLIYADDCGLEVEHSLFRNNNVPSGEGLLHTLGGDIYSTSIINSTFRGNYANRGSALYHTSNATAYIYGNCFVENSAKSKGVIVLYAEQNIQDIRLVNNSFIANRIDVLSGFQSKNVGGSAIWEELSNNGCMTLMNNTIVGNYTACRNKSGATATNFPSGAVYCRSGMLGAYNNIIAGNYSSLAGRGDVYMEDTKLIRGHSKNIFSSTDNTNYPMGISNIKASSYAAACTELVNLLGGAVKDSVYYPEIKTYGEDPWAYALSPLCTRYAGKDINILDANALSAATAGSDILNVGSLSGTLTEDQIGTQRNTYSVPGAMEALQTPSGLEMQNAQCTMHNGKHIYKGRIVIEKNGLYYDILGNRIQ